MKIPYQIYTGKMFTFKFSTNETEDYVSDTEDEKIWKKSKEIIYTKDDAFIQDLINNSEASVLKYSNDYIKYLNSKKVVELLTNMENSEEISALKADQNHSDLLPAVYEGGLKIWECSYDLLKYLEQSNLNFEGKRVLDLGCGTGLVGISTLVGGSECYFQDYNEEVIRYFTIPNILLNNEELIKKCNFFSGDWESFSSLIKERFFTDDDKFDFIFTSETIYNTESYYKLHQVFENSLKRTGIIFLAAKLFYFGVGGGVSLFQDFINQCKVFKYDTCWQYTEGVKRIIMQLKFNT